MNGNCTTTLGDGGSGGDAPIPTITPLFGRANVTYCFCDSYDGCNSAGVTQLSLFLFGVIVLTHLAF